MDLRRREGRRGEDHVQVRRSAGSRLLITWWSGGPPSKWSNEDVEIRCDVWMSSGPRPVRWWTRLGLVTPLSGALVEPVLMGAGSFWIQVLWSRFLRGTGPVEPVPPRSGSGGDCSSWIQVLWSRIHLVPGLVEPVPPGSRSPWT